MLLLNNIVGFSSDAKIAERLHDLQHRDAVEYLLIQTEDVDRRRLRLKTDKNTDCAVAIGRDEKLSDGAVLKIDSDSAIVIRVAVQSWLTLSANSHASALQLGYFAGNLHWKVQFDGTRLRVALEGPRSDYYARLTQFSDWNNVTVHDADD